MHARCPLRVISGQTVASQNPTLSAMIQKRTNYCDAAIVRFVPIAADAPQQTVSLFDHLVGGGEQSRRHGEAERLGGLEVDEKFDLGGPLDWQVRRLLALEYAAGIDTSQVVRICNPASVAGQAAGCHERAILV